MLPDYTQYHVVYVQLSAFVIVHYLYNNGYRVGLVGTDAQWFAHKQLPYHCNTSRSPV